MAKRAIVPVLFLTMLSAGLSSGQGTSEWASITCTPGVPYESEVRFEGMSELAGDVIIYCTGGTPMTAASGPATATGTSTNAIPQMTVVFDLGSPVASRILGDGGVSEALLMVDDPGGYAGGYVGAYGVSLPDLVCPTPTAAAWQSADSPGCQEWVGNIGSNSNVPVLSTAGTTNTTPGYNIFPGVVSGNTVTFSGVPLLPPGPGVYRTFRITNIRVNVPSVPQLSAPISHVTLQTPLVTDDLSSWRLPLFYADSDVETRVFGSDDNDNLKAPVFVQTSGVGSPGSPAFVGYLSFIEESEYTFRTRTLADYGLMEDVPNAPYWAGGESGFIPYFGSTPQYFAGNTSIMPGLADSGTRLKATFQNIPAGVTIYVATRGAGNTTNGLVGQMVTSPTAAETAPPVAPAISSGGVGYVPLSPSGGTASVYWEIVGRPATGVARLAIPVAIYATPGAAELGKAQVNMSFAPTPSDISAGQFIPEFAGNVRLTDLFTIIAAPASFATPAPGSTVVLNASGGSVNVTGTADSTQPISFSVSVAYASGDPGWLNAYFSGTDVGLNGACTGDGSVRSTPIPLPLHLDCSSAKLSVGTHTATVTLTALTPASAGTLTFYVQYTVTALPVFAASPANLIGSNAVVVAPGAKASATVQLSTTSATAASFTLSPSNTWVLATSVNSQVSASAPATVTVTCDATNLSPRIYNEHLTVRFDNSSDLIIDVECVVAVPALTFVPSTLAWTYANGHLTPDGSQNVTLETPNADSYNLSASYPSGATGGNWLDVQGVVTGLTDGAVLSVGPFGYLTNYQTLPNGSYTATITATDASNPVISKSLPVTITVTGSTGTALTISPSQVNLNAANNYQQTVTLTSGLGGSLAWTSSVQWLHLSSNTHNISAGGSAPLTVTADTSVTGAGTFTASVAVWAGATQQLTVFLTVGGAPDGAVNGYFAPAALNVAGVSGGSSVAGQVVFVGSGSFSISSSPAYSANSGTTAWLSASAVSGDLSATGTALTLSCDPGTLAPGTYTATLGTTIATDGGSSSPSIQVAFVVTGGQAMESNPPTEILNDGAAQQDASIQITATGATPLPFNLATDRSWLTAAVQDAATTPATIVVTADSSALSPGLYAGNVTLTNPNIVSLDVPVVLIVPGASNPGGLTVSTQSLSFSAQTGAGAPAAQTLTVSGTAGSAAVPFTASASSSGGWLSVNPAAGSTPATLTVSVNQASLAAGNYTGSISITPAGGTAVNVQVSLTVANQQSIAVNPASLNFAFRYGSSSAVASSQLTVTAAGGNASFTATASSSGNWLSVTPSSGSTSSAATLTVSVNPAGLSASAQPYTGTITVAGTGGTLGSETVDVSLTISAPPPAIANLLNGASYANGPVSPGEIVSIFGTGLGPATGVALTLDSTGKVATSIGGVAVSFGGYPAPLIYASDTQINAVVPYEVAGTASPLVAVTFAGQTSNAPALNLASSAPGLFTQNSRGFGPGAILNGDSTLNTQANPAARGSVIQLFMTGEGAIAPAEATGTVTVVNSSGVGPLTPAPQLAVSVLIGGQPAQTAWVGEAPGCVAGVLQVNVAIPATAGSGAVPITVQVGNAVSQSGVTVWVN